MDARHHFLTGLVLSVASFCCTALLHAQDHPEPRMSSAQKPRLVAKSVDAPDWLLWHAFHDMNKQIAGRIPGEANILLASRFGIARSTAARLQELGEVYGEKIHSLISEERSVMSRNSIAAFDAKKEAALQKHRELVVALIGEEGRKKVERWLDEEMRKHVRAFAIDNDDPPPAPLAPGPASITTGR